MTEFITHFSENDFRPYQSEFSTLKNIAFVPSNASNIGVNLDLQYDSQFILCFWDMDTKSQFTKEYLSKSISDFRQRNYATMNQLKVELLSDKILNL